MRYRFLLVLSVPPLAALATWLTLRPPLPAAEAQVPDDFAIVREHLRTFDAASFDVRHNGQYLTLQVSSTGEVAIDPFRDAIQNRYLWTDGELRMIGPARGDDPCPDMLRVPAPPQIAEVWAELRSGLAGSTITRTLPSEIGFQESWTTGDRDSAVVMVRLPFTWAEEMRFFVEYLPADGSLLTLLVTDPAGRPLPPPLPRHKPGGRFAMSFHTEYPQWDVPLDPGIFRTSFADVQVPAHKKCEKEQGHRHGPELHREHSSPEIHGEGEPRHRGAWDPSCDPDDDHDHDHGQGQGQGQGQGHDDHGQGHGYGHDDDHGDGDDDPGHDDRGSEDR